MFDTAVQVEESHDALKGATSAYQPSVAAVVPAPTVAVAVAASAASAWGPQRWQGRQHMMSESRNDKAALHASCTLVCGQHALTESIGVCFAAALLQVALLQVLWLTELTQVLQVLWLTEAHAWFQCLCQAYWLDNTL
eukprot:CAMPEP_0172791170 /NCGR_PEP_ID=MMETSP1074-20121228/208335_1 /TAXON_ID=2916 /ORGANISM="Ceratium fusus, Strain PA161109" /LENGTH=137 /DNA_ID=CAMNT_0013628227 /DNA_START=530 /DNA_END=943 /DNA_ORIENTATION=+